MSARDRWIDSTTYRPGEQGCVPPREWVWTGNYLRVTVTRVAGESPSAWFLGCSDVNAGRRLLKASSVGAAKVEALAIVRALLAAMLADLDAGEAT